MINLVKWHIRGYAGFGDCDGQSDYNLDYYLYMSVNVTKEEIETMLFNCRYKDKRVVELSIKRVLEVECQ